MNSKKKTPAAQQLIDSLLDELPLVSKKKSGKGGSASSSTSTIEGRPRELVFVPDTSATGEVILENGQRITIRDEDAVDPRARKQIQNKSFGLPAKDAAQNMANAGNRFPPQKPQVASGGKVVTSSKQSDSQILANFKKNVREMSDDSVIFTGELGTEGTNTMLEQAGKTPKVKANSPQSSHEDLGDPLFQKTKSLQFVDVSTNVGTNSVSSGNKSNSLHIHSVKKLDENLGPAVDLLVEAMELTNPAFKKPERILPKAESTPRRDIKDAPQVEDLESSDEFIGLPNKSSAPDPSIEAAQTVVGEAVHTNSGPAAQTAHGFDAPYTNEIDLDLETGSSNEEDAGLPAIPDIKKFNAMPLSQHELSFPSEELAAAALDAVSIEMLAHHQTAIGNAETQGPNQNIDLDLESLLMENAKAIASSVLPSIAQTVVRPSAKPEARHVLNDEPRKSDQKPGEKSIEKSGHQKQDQKHDQKRDKKVSDAVAALPKLASKKPSAPTPKDVSILENGRGVLDRVLAKVRGSGLEKSINFKDAIVKRIEGKADSHDEQNHESHDQGASEEGDKSSSMSLAERFKLLIDAPEPVPVASQVARQMLSQMSGQMNGQMNGQMSSQQNSQQSGQPSAQKPAQASSSSEDLGEFTLPVINAEASRAGSHTASVLPFPNKTLSSGMRWTESSSQSDIKVPQPSQGSADLDEHTLPPIEASKQGPLDTMDRMMATEIRPGAIRAREQQEEFINQGKENPRQSAKQSGGAGYGIPSFHSAEASLKQSESLRIAQTRISDLEQELERLRRENEKLASAGETLRRHSDELRARAENAEQERRESERIRDEERKVMRGQMSQKDRENIESRTRLEEAEGRLESNFKKIRVRERELEHRLEIMKMESATLVSTKDKMILELKRQMDQLTHENEYGKQKAQEAFNQYKAKQETARRVVRALRIALTILEGDDENVVPHKKAE